MRCVHTFVTAQYLAWLCTNQFTLSLVRCVYIVRLLNAWLNILHGFAPISLLFPLFCMRCALPNAWLNILHGCSPFNYSLVVHALCACLLYGSISCMAVHQSTFALVLHALCACLLHESISSMAVHQSTFPLVLHALCTCLQYDLISSMAVHQSA